MGHGQRLPEHRSLCPKSVLRQTENKEITKGNCSTLSLMPAYSGDGVGLLLLLPSNIHSVSVPFSLSLSGCPGNFTPLHLQFCFFFSTICIWGTAAGPRLPVPVPVLSGHPPHSHQGGHAFLWNNMIPPMIQCIAEILESPQNNKGENSNLPWLFLSSKKKIIFSFLFCTQ